MSNYLIYALLSPVIIFITDRSLAQEKKIIHKARTSVIIPGLRREFVSELAHISIETNPGWQGEETYDDSDHIYQLVFTDPIDSNKRFLSLLMQQYDSKGFDSSKWDKLKQSIRESYGNRNIAVRPLNDGISGPGYRDTTGIIAHYEILAKHHDYIEYIDAVVGKSALLLVTVPIKPDEYMMKIGYFRDVASSLKLK